MLLPPVKETIRVEQRGKPLLKVLSPSHGGKLLGLLHLPRLTIAPSPNSDFPTSRSLFNLVI